MSGGSQARLSLGAHRRLIRWSALLVSMSIGRLAPTATATPNSADTGPASVSPATSQKIADEGDLSVEYRPSESHRALADAVKQAGVLALLMPDLNRSLSLPRDLPVIFDDCGQINAFYSSQKGRITICYELVDYLEKALLKGYPKADDAETALRNALAFVFFHELGHALIDIYNLDITGREEDAADQVATVLLLKLPHGEVMAIHGALAFGLLAAGDGNIADLPFWDVHSFGKQRYFNIICWVYGSNPDPTFRDAVTKAGLPASRSERCIPEYRRMQKAWLKLLSPFLKSDISP